MRTDKHRTKSFTLTIGLFFLFSLLSSTAFCAEITLSWSRPDDDRVAGYNIYHGETGTNFKSAPGQSIDSPDITSCTISELKEGQTYDFAATSLDGNGNESDFSETINHTVGSTETTDDENQLLVFGDTADAHELGTLTDTFININEETNSASEQLNTYTWPENTPANAILLKADLSALPDGAEIQSAVLHLYQTAAGGDGSYDLSVHKILNHNPEFNGANGYTYDGVKEWTANSDCYNDIPLAQADITAAEDVKTLNQEPGYKQWDISGMAKAWVDNPDANYGLMINSDDSAAANSHRYFAASEAADANTRPRLEITFTVDPDDADNDGDGYSVNDGDCNDNDASVYPGAEEICGDGIDQNCDGTDAACTEENDDTSNDGSDSESGDDGSSDDGSSDADSGDDSDNTDDQTDGTVSEDTQFGDVTLSWSRPDDDRIAGYNLYYGKSGTDFKSAPDVTIDAADTTSHTFFDLETGYEYAFAATSLDGNGNESDFSETIYYSVDPEDSNETDNDGSDSESGDDGSSDDSSSDADSGGDGDNTDDQTDGTVSEDTQSGDVTLSWSRPDDDRVAGYNLYYGKSGTDFKSTPDVTIDAADTTSHTFFDLETGYEYAFAATSLDGNGNESDFSETVYHTAGSTDETSDNTADTSDDSGEDTTNEQETDSTDPESDSGTDSSDDESTDEQYISEDVFEDSIEFAEIEINHEWQSVIFEKIFYDPVIVAKPMSLNGSDPGVIRIKNLNWEGFDIRIQEWEYLDDWHVNENASYLVVEAGRHELPNGIQMEAATFETNSTQNVSFSRPFNQKPVVICSVTTENERTAVTGRIHNITKDRFDFDLQQQEANKDGHNALETISFIAWEPSSDTIAGISYIVDTTFDEVTDELHAITFYPSFETSPVFVADMQTKDGRDTANVRWQNKNAGGVEVLIDEEQSKDSEVKHITEAVGYMSFSLSP
ncbi:hypothetical protein HNR65_003384 [Desulfosalsimonas propionicica]|uniref:Fibronectin type-III domain-containing protein n=1 Tax=Desulfosalsimonas propionicica TaxID=332175 RepID=A0A7W0CC39_9BACT|nr:fibronectin type III domain-containing protein [Desulfosalsimonas propionicica]MBA2883027.1 hypothetical protein [Desulfosalsimonas propionicica]